MQILYYKYTQHVSAVLCSLRYWKSRHMEAIKYLPLPSNTVYDLSTHFKSKIKVNYNQQISSLDKIVQITKE